MKHGEQGAAQATIWENNVYLSDAAGNRRQLTFDGRAKENVTLSPDRSMLVYNLARVAGDSGPWIFEILEAVSAKRLRRVEAQSEARFVSELVWLKSDLILAIGEGGYVLVMDPRKAAPVISLYCDDPRLSPDSRMLAFRRARVPKYGPTRSKGARELGILLLSPSGTNAPELWVVFPETRRFEPDENKIAGSDGVIVSPVGWSNTSDQLAFVEERAGQQWLVVLTPELGMRGVAAKTHRIRLPRKLTGIHDLAWRGDGSVRVSARDATLTVDVRSNAVREG